jgi:OPT family oligopeptide transporter
MNYIIINFGVTAAISHVFLIYGKSIWKNFKASLKKEASDEDDIHVRLMKAYPEVNTVIHFIFCVVHTTNTALFFKKVPNWWYYTVYVLGIALNIGVAYANKSQLPWWGVIFAIVLSTCLSLPLNLITAVTGQTFGLNVLTELICGLILPGLPIANMYFKTLGYNTMSQAGAMAKDLKIGYYLKVPPRMTFIHQIIGTIIGCIFNYIVNVSITQSKREILLDPIGNQFWNGATPQTINSAAITWGAIGPIAMFGPDTQYYIILWAFIIGLALPIPGYLLHKKFPNAGFHLINIPMILMGLSLLPGTSSSWITVSFGIILVTQGYIKQRHSTWFARHNYLISAALDSGTSLMVFFVSMAVWWCKRCLVRVSYLVG